VFNQGELSVEELLEIPVTAEEKLYRLDLSSGEIFREEKAQIKLLCGDMAVYLVTKDTYDTVVDDVEYTIPVTDLKPVAVKQFQINSLGMEWQERETDAIADENFSGEITYAGEYCLPMMPKEGQRYRVVLEDTSVSATIVIGGERVAAVGITPMRALIPAEKLVQKGRIEIIVANTAANEILAKQDVINSWPKEEVGPYHERQCQFEVSRPPLRLGRVVLEKLI